MNKKFLSAILFGALMVTSTGTFVSCKDYDDDIKNLQGQIDTNKSAIAELQKLVGQGKWVSSISSITDGFTVNMSDGSSVQITGIKGADGKDGKNGTEWTIGEDGYWYMDGEKTENLAVAQNGKDGVTAPSPKIENGLWVVYNWDAEKGEFVAETTDIPAAGTSAFVVKANGVYTLNIADENGEYQEITLPATSDSFVAAAPAARVNVTFEQANWKPVTTKGDKEIFAKMTEAFPALAEYKKGDLMIQGGNLPVVITPANVELNNDFSFALQSAKGVISEAKVSNPVKGMPEVTTSQGSYMATRTAEANDAFWTLSVEPAKNKKGDKYVGISSSDCHSLVVVNEKGTVVKTPFAYYLSIIGNEDVTISQQLGSVDYAEAIDIFALNEDGKSIFKINHGLNGYYLLEATDLLQVEQYGLSVEGSKLMIADMPANKTSIHVTLKLTAVGLNGSVAEKEIGLNIGQQLEATGTLADKTVTLGYDKKAGYNQEVRWDIEDLGFTATQLNQFLNADWKKLYVTYEDEDGNVITEATEDIVAYDKDGKSTNVDYKNAVTFGFNLNSKTYEPKEYAIRLEVKESEYGPAVYVAEATLTVENPTLGENYVKLVPGFVDENGVYQITGTPTEDAVAYSLENALILGDAAELINIYDLDNFEYTEDERDDEAYEMYNWVVSPLSLDNRTWKLVVNKWAYDWEAALPTWTGADWSEELYNQLYKTRKIRAEIGLFGNPNNVVPFDFEVVVKSEIYTETPADAITIDAMEIEFGAVNVSGTDADESVIDIKSAISKAVSTAGTDKGKAYRLFATGKGAASGVVNQVVDYSDPKTAGGFVLGTDGNIVTLSVEEYLLMTDAFPALKLDAVEHAAIISGEATYKLKDSDWTAIWKIATLYYNKANGTGKYIDQNNDGEIDDNDKVGGSLIFSYSGTKTYTDVEDDDPTTDIDESNHKERMAIYDAFKTKIGFTVTTAANSGTPITVLDKVRDSRIASVTIAFDEPEVAINYFNFKNSDGEYIIDPETGVVFEDKVGNKFAGITIKPVAEAPNSVTGGQVSVDMTLTIRDAWGMIMEVPFQVTVKTAK